MMALGVFALVVVVLALSVAFGLIRVLGERVAKLERILAADMALIEADDAGYLARERALYLDGIDLNERDEPRGFSADEPR